MATADEPPAFLYHPSDVALLQRYLGPRVVSGGLACSWIHEEDLYAADPADLTARHPAATDGDGESVWYFFTPIRTKKGFKDRRKNRAVPSGLGSWFSERAAKPVVAVDGARREVVGQKQTFAFTEKDEEGDRMRSGWLMVELRLPGDVPLALCKVYFTPRVAKATVAAAAHPRTEILPSTGPPPEHAAPRTKTAPPPEHRTPRPSEEAVPGAPPLLPDLNLPDSASPRPTHGEDAASAAPPTACRTPPPRRISGTHLEDAARAATPSSEDAPGGSPSLIRSTGRRAVGTSTTEWLLVQLDARDAEQTLYGISLRRVYGILPFEDDGNDKLASAPPRPKKTFGWLMLEGENLARSSRYLEKSGCGSKSVKNTLQGCHLRAAGEECADPEQKKRRASAHCFELNPCSSKVRVCEEDDFDKMELDARQAETCRLLMLEGVHGGQEQQDLRAGAASLLSVAMEGAAASSNNAGRSLGDGAATEAQADADMEEAERVE